MVDYLQTQKQDLSNVLEPSAGDGRFLSLLQFKAARIDAIELFDFKVTELQKKYKGQKFGIMQADFVEYAMAASHHYSLVVGNPPYINPKIMEDETVNKARELCKAEGLAGAVMQNMWVAFVIGACRVLRPGGAIFFVLPMEFLQVQYAEKLRLYLENRFNTIHIISFQKFIFSDIEQEICLVYLTNKKQCPPHILYNIYQDADQRKPIRTNIIQKNKPLQKWSNAILSDEEITLLKSKTANYKRVDETGAIAPGIVTGGNEYFILTKEKVKECACEKYVLPILQKSSFITQNTIIINNSTIEQLQRDSKPMYLLDLARVKETLPEPLKEYLEWAGKQKKDENSVALKKRFKCINRIPWYGVPIVNKGGVIFFKRYGALPRLYINEANIHTTDAGYHIRLKQEYDKASFVFCFYNSMTLAQCEYNGRYYGGGVRELVPSEFKKTTVPYRTIEQNNIDRLERMFQEKASTKSIVDFVNSCTIAQDMDVQDIEKLEEIRRKLAQHRSANRG